MASLIQTIAKDLSVSPDYIERIVVSAPYRYKEYAIPKKNGKGTRAIAQPSREVKEIQRWIVKNILSSVKIHDCAHAYRSGRSIKTNAELHKKSNYTLKMDFRNFFPSISSDDFAVCGAKWLKTIGSDEDINCLRRLLFYVPKGENRLVLSIGAPSSPMLSNIIMKDIDALIERCATKNCAIYTRYADDLTFSFRDYENIRNVKSSIREILEKTVSPRIEINTEKTLILTKKYRRVVTGLVIGNQGEISIGRDKKRIISSMVYRYKNNLLEVGESERLKGLLAYCNSVEPLFISRLAKKYGLQTIKEIQRMEMRRKSISE